MSHKAEAVFVPLNIAVLTVSDTRTFETDGWSTTMLLVNLIAFYAEAADHHPDILLHEWNKVRITLSTHSAGGLTKNDFDLAGALDQIGA